MPPTEEMKKSYHQYVKPKSPKNKTTPITTNRWDITDTPSEQPSSPAERSGHCMVSDSNYLYLFGGFNEPGTVYQDLWRFDTCTGLWEELPTSNHEDHEVPVCTVSSSMVIIEHNLFVFGGTSFPFSKQNSNTLYVYDLRRKQWFNVNQMVHQRLENDKNETLTEYPRNHVKVKECGCKELYDTEPTAKYGQSMVHTPDTQKLHIFYGTLGTTFIAEHHSFDLETFRWVKHTFCTDHGRTCDRENQGRYKAQAVTDDVTGCIYLMGGANLDTYFGFQEVDVYDTKQEKWEVVATRSTEFTPGQQSNNNNNNDNNNNNNNETEQEMVFPCPRKAHSCVKYGNSVYLSGGIFTAFKQDGTKVDRIYNDVWKLDLTKRVWNKLSKVSKRRSF